MIPQVPTAAELPEDWPLIVRKIVRDEGRAVRGPFDRAVIEVKSLTDNRWRPLMLPGGGTRFTNCAERDLILTKILLP